MTTAELDNAVYSWLYDCQRVDTLGYPVCVKPGISRRIQKSHKSSDFISTDQGVYSLDCRVKRNQHIPLSLQLISEYQTSYTNKGYHPKKSLLEQINASHQERLEKEKQQELSK